MEPSRPESKEPYLDLADACVRFVDQSLGITLDYTPETLPLLDHYVRNVDASASEETRMLLAATTGAYFGEVIARSFGDVRWHTEGDDYATWRLEFETCFLHFNPIGVALEAITQEDAEGWSSHLQMFDEDREAVHESLERLGRIAEDDYYRFSVRFEVIEQVQTVLIARAAQLGKAGHRFGPEVYAAALGESTPSSDLH